MLFFPSFLKFCLLEGFQLSVFLFSAAAAAPTVTATVTFDPRTWLCHIGNVHPLLLCHEAQDGKYSEARHKAGTAVQASQQQTVPMSHTRHDEGVLETHTRTRNPGGGRRHHPAPGSDMGGCHYTASPPYWDHRSPIAVVFVFVVAPQWCHGSQAKWRRRRKSGFLHQSTPEETEEERHRL